MDWHLFIAKFLEWYLIFICVCSTANSLANIEKPSVLSVILSFIIVLLNFGVFATWAAGHAQPSAYTLYTILLGPAVFINCLNFTYSLFKLEKKIERKLLINVERPFYFYTVRLIFVLTPTAISTALATGIFSGLAVQFSDAQYQTTPKFQEILNYNKKQKLAMFERTNKECIYIFNRLSLYDKEKIDFDSSLFWSDDATAYISDGPNIHIKFSRLATGEGRPSMDTIRLSAKNYSCQHSNADLSFIKKENGYDKSTLLKIIYDRIKNQEKLKSLLNEEESHPRLIAYAAANVYKYFGEIRIDYRALNDSAEFVDLLNLWFFRIVIGGVFYLSLILDKKNI